MPTETEQIRNRLIAREQDRGTMRGAINANCIGCTYDPLDVGNWRQQVGACEITTCPFHQFRPKSRPEAPSR